MPLCTPLLGGPLTAWSATIRVDGALPGATVAVRSLGPNPRVVAKDIVGGGSDRLALLGGVQLQPQDRLVVQQTLGVESSEWTPDHLALHVGAPPKSHGEIAPLSFRSRVFQCGAKLWVQGAVPGAHVTIRNGATVIATGRADEGGNARLPLKLDLPGPGKQIVALQEAPAGIPALAGTPNQITADVLKLPVAPEERLPVPVLAGPAPVGCDRSVPIGGVLDGAEVTLTRRTTGASETLVFDLDALRCILATPLATTGDELSVTQAMPRCRQFRPSDPLKIAVGGQGKPPTPVAHPPCPDSTDIFVEQLLPGATVFVKTAGEEFRAMVPPTATTLVCRVKPMLQFSPVEIWQDRCGLPSDHTTVSVKGKGGAPAPNTIDLADPLFQCARAVRVIDADPPCWLQVWSDSALGPVPISAQFFSLHASRQVPVTPYLMPDRDIWVSQLPCDGKWKHSRRHRAGPAHDLPPVQIIVPVIDGATSVVVDATPGAAVSVYAVNWDTWKTSLIGYGVVDPRDMHVPLVRPVTMRDGPFAQQTLCERTSRPGGIAIVRTAIQVFTLTGQLKRNSHVNNPKPVVCTAAQVTCRHDGGYVFTASAENQETKADCVYFRVDFTCDWPGPPAFGAAVEGSLSAAGEGEITEKGLRTLGIPSKNNFTKSGFVDAFRDPVYWSNFVGTTGKFALNIARFKDYEPGQDAPDTDPDKD